MNPQTAFPEVPETPIQPTQVPNREEPHEEAFYDDETPRAYANVARAVIFVEAFALFALNAYMFIDPEPEGLEALGLVITSVFVGIPAFAIMLYIAAQYRKGKVKALGILTVLHLLPWWLGAMLLSTYLTMLVRGVLPNVWLSSLGTLFYSLPIIAPGAVLLAVSLKDRRLKNWVPWMLVIIAASIIMGGIFGMMISQSMRMNPD